MIKLGHTNRLLIKRIGAYNIYLDGGDSGEVMLTDSAIEEPAVGDELDVFVYKDADETLVATTNLPRVVAGACASMSVVALTDNGAFLNWGLKSDLFVPRSEQLGEMSVGTRCVAYAMLDKTSGRMIASTRLYKYLSDENNSAFKTNQKVDLLICQRTDLGYKAVVNGTHLGVLYSGEVFTDIQVGDEVSGYVKAPREDKKIDLILQQPGATARTDAEIKILDYLKKHNGESTLTDKSPPQEIYNTFGISKKVFKNAVGGLYKNRLVLLSKEKITLVEQKGKS